MNGILNKATFITYHVNWAVSFRNCKLSTSSFSMASVDILYIDITRRWAGMLPDSREAGKWPTNHDAIGAHLHSRGQHTIKKLLTASNKRHIYNYLS